MGKITFNTGNLSATVLKAMSIFGGVQVITIICSIIRTKLVAIWIGAVGVGLFGLYNTTAANFFNKVTGANDLYVQSCSYLVEYAIFANIFAADDN